MSEFMKPGAAAEALGVSRETIRRYVDNGDLAAIITPGGQRRIETTAVEEIRQRISSTVTVIKPC